MQKLIMHNYMQLHTCAAKLTRILEYDVKCKYSRLIFGSIFKPDKN